RVAGPGAFVLVLHGVGQLLPDVFMFFDDEQAFPFHDSMPPPQWDDGRVAPSASRSPPATRSSSRSRSWLQLWFVSTEERPAAAKRSRAAESRSKETTARLNSAGFRATRRSRPATAL